MLSLFALAASMMLNAQQNVVWQDDFSSDKGWQTFEFKREGKAEYTKDEKFLLKCELEGINHGYISKCKTTLNASKNFIIKVDAESRSGLKDDSYFGIVFNYLDSKNYMCFVVEKGFAYFIEFKQGDLVRYDYDIVKKTKAKTFELQLKKIGNTVTFIINDEDALEIEKVDVITNKIGLCVLGKTQVAFDNMKILQ